MVNAFWLDRDLEQTVAWLVDTHVTSSVFECSMALATAVQLRGLVREDLSFTHPDNPLTRWAAESHANWRYLRSYTVAAHEEWRYRWDHTDDEYHGSWSPVRALDAAAVEALDWPSEGRSDPPQLTAGWTADDYVDAYRYYYANEKRHLFSWSKGRSEPPWLDRYKVDESAAPDSLGRDTALPLVVGVADPTSGDGSPADDAKTSTDS